VASTVDEAFQKSYAGFLTAVLQQQDSVLQNLVTMAGGYKGEKVQPVKFVGTFEFQEKLSRLQEVVYIEPPYSARALAPRVWRVAPIFDRQDELFIGFSPQGAIAQGGRYAMNRKKDSIIAGSFLGSALTGKDGSTSTAFDTTNQDVASSVGGASTGFNYAKFLAGWQILGQNHALDGG
jgi:hypothetical protein